MHSSPEPATVSHLEQRVYVMSTKDPVSGESGIVNNFSFVVNEAESGNPLFRIVGEQT